MVVDKRRRIGELLLQAGLITEEQLQVALADQSAFGGLHRIGEILAMRGWIDRETIEIFAGDIHEAIQDPTEMKLGDYLVLAKLLDRDRVEQLLEEQQHSGVRLGTMAVQRGWIKQQTLDFLLAKLFPALSRESGLQPKLSAADANVPELLDESEDDLRALLAEHGIAVGEDEF